MNRLVISCVLLLLVGSLSAQAPKREFRSVWLATVYGIDWPKSKIYTTGNVNQINAQKQQLITILDSLVSANMNALAFQVRSRSDAMYKSSYEPWSSDLVATRGMEPGYDPLAFAVEEAHKRGLEVHAWINPYRYESSIYQWDGLPGAYRNTHPEWLIDVMYADGKSASRLNPGIPEVRERITDIIKEIVSNYDIDGVMFDDYFYPEGIGDQDKEEFEIYNPDSLSLGDWRRAQVNKLVESVYRMIQETKPYCRFGIGPAGIWGGTNEAQEKYGVANPVGITGGYAFDGIYCDPLAWLTEGTIDYITPQIYWTTGSGNTDYNVLAPWWSDVATQRGKHFYSSQSLDSMDASLRSSVTIDGEVIRKEGLSSIEWAACLEAVSVSTRAFGFSEIGGQIQTNRSSDKNQAPGTVFYSASKLYQTIGFVQYLKDNCFGQKALPPAISWKEHPTYGKVENVSVSNGSLQWDKADGDVRYSVYAVSEQAAADNTAFASSEALLGITYGNTFPIPAHIDAEATVFGVAILDRYGNEFPVTLAGRDETAGVPVSLTYPLNGEIVQYPFDFKWEGNPDNYFNIIEIASDADFRQKVTSRELTSDSFPAEKMQELDGDKTYFWRVVSRKANATDVYSEVRSFEISKLAITYPQNNSVEVSISPEIVWTDYGSAATYTLEVSNTLNFSSASIVFSREVNTHSFTIPDYILKLSTKYYARVKTTVNGRETVSGFVIFTTANTPIPTPVIVSPQQNESLSGTSVTVKWEGSGLAVDGYQVELSATPVFGRNSIIKRTAGGVFETEYEITASGTYYVHVRAIDSRAIKWSNVVSFRFLHSTPIDHLYSENRQVFLTRTDLGYKLIVISENTAFFSAGMYHVNGTKVRNVYSGWVYPGRKELVVDTSGLPDGLYIMKWTIDDKLYSLKFILD